MSKPIIYDDGSTRWYLNGHLHREDGPAIEYLDGNKVWYLNGKLHRLDGPAFEHKNGTKEWYLNGKQYTEEEFAMIQFVKGINIYRVIDESI